MRLAKVKKKLGPTRHYGKKPQTPLIDHQWRQHPDLAGNRAAVQHCTDDIQSR